VRGTKENKLHLEREFNGERREYVEDTACKNQRETLAVTASLWTTTDASLPPSLPNEEDPYPALSPLHVCLHALPTDL